MAQGLETLGSFLDSKPLKARDQSKLRFSHAINRLMPKEYSQFNNNHRLYDQLRASLAHTFTTSRSLLLSSNDNPEFGKKHLHEKDEKLILVAENFYNDFKKACLRRHAVPAETKDSPQCWGVREATPDTIPGN